MNDLCEFLIKNLILDFDAAVDHETLQGFIQDDDSPLASSLRERLTPEKLDDFLIVLGDCLREHIRTGIDAAAVTKQIGLFVDS